MVDKTPGSVDETKVKFSVSSHSSPIIVSPKEVLTKPSRPEILPEKIIETEIPDEPDVYHSPVSPLHYPENNSRERCGLNPFDILK